MTEIFSKNDIRNLVASFSIGSTYHSSDDSKHTQISLVPNSRCDGFVKTSFLFSRLRSIIFEAAEGLDSKYVSQNLDIPENSVQEIIFHSEKIILSYKNDKILPREQFCNLLDRLRSQIVSGFINIDSFCQETDIKREHITAFLEPSPSQATEYYNVSFDEKVKAIKSGSQGTFVTSKEFWHETKASVLEKIRDAETQKEQVVLRNIPQGIDGPTLFAGLVEEIQSENALLQGGLEIEEKQAKFTPHSWLDANFNNLINDMRVGDRAVVEFDDLKVFDRLESSPAATRSRFINDIGEAAICTPSAAASKAWIKKMTTSAGMAMATDGFVHIKAGNDVPHGIFHHIILPAVEDELKSKGTDVARLEDIFFDSSYLQGLGGRLIDCTKKRASSQGEVEGHAPNQLEQPSGNQLLEMIAQLSNENKKAFTEEDVFNRLYNHFETDIKETYFKELSRLEKKSEEEVCAIWKPNVLCLNQLYQSGIRDCSDQKLQDLLRPVLFEHMATELVPRFLESAKIKSLLKSEKLRKSSEKMLITLKEIQSSPGNQIDQLEALSKNLDKFSKQLGISELKEMEIRSKKEEMTQDLVKSIQKDKNTPRLFLSLILVLWSRNREGMLYATGKFAPKILKAMKNDIPEQLYADLETYKDAVKSSTVTQDQVNEIRRIASS